MAQVCQWQQAADQRITDVTTIAEKLRYTVSDMASSVALAEQLRLFKVVRTVSQLVLAEKEKRS